MGQRGRPTDYRPEYCDQVIAWGSEGKSLTWMAAQLGVSRESLYQWERVNPDFADALTRARTNCQAWWEEAGQNGLAVPQFNAALWTKNMASRFKADWSDKAQVELSGPNGGPVQQAMTVEFVDAGPVPGQA